MKCNGWVAPLAGAWIEMYIQDMYYRHIPRRSPCGSVDRNNDAILAAWAQTNVAPLAGAWIEIATDGVLTGQFVMVAPLAGAWIEM